MGVFFPGVFIPGLFIPGLLQGYLFRGYIFMGVLIQGLFIPGVFIPSYLFRVIYSEVIYSGHRPERTTCTDEIIRTQYTIRGQMFARHAISPFPCVHESKITRLGMFDDGGKSCKVKDNCKMRW